MDFDTRASVAAASIPAAVTCILVYSYAAGCPVEPAPYVRGTSGSALAIQDALGNYWGIVSTSVYPEWFGAYCDGGVHDDAIPLRAAMAHLKLLAGSNNCVLRLASRTYTLKSTDNGRILNPASNVSIVGAGRTSVLRVANNLTPGNSFFGIYPATQANADRVDFAEFRDFTFDMNGANNHDVNSQYSALGVEYGFGLVVDNLWIVDCPGSQPMTFGVNAGLTGYTPPNPATPTVINIQITNCKIIQSGTATNPHITDWSGIYVIASDFLVAGNQIENPTQDTVGTGIELHGDGVACNNILSRMAKGFNAGAYPDSHITITDNQIRSVYSALTVWDTIRDGQPAFNTDVLFANNRVTQVDGSRGFLIDAYGWIDGTLDVSVKIIDNHFRSLEAAGTSSTFHVIANGRTRDMDVRGNTAINFSGGFFFQGPAVIDGVSNLRVDNNTIRDCCRSSNSSQTEYKSAISISQTAPNTFAAISVKGNIIENTNPSTPYITTGIYNNVSVKATTGRAQISDNAIINLPTPINWTGGGRVEGIWLSYTPTLTSAGGTKTLAMTGTTASGAGKYRLSNRTLEVQLTVTITTAGTASDDISSTAPNNYVLTNNTAIAGKEWAMTGKTVTGLGLAGGSDLSFRYYDNSSAWGSGNKVTVFAVLQVD